MEAYILQDYIAHRCHDGIVLFEVIMSIDQLDKAQKEGLPDKFKITADLDTNTMHLLGVNGERVMYDNPEKSKYD